MNTWKYTDATQQVIYRHTAQGGMESCSAAALPEGDSIESLGDPEVAARLQAEAVKQMVAMITDQTQARLDSFARTRGYDSIISAVTYAGDPDSRLAREGDYAKVIRSSTWATLFAYTEAVKSGLRPMPSGWEDVEPLLPIPTWPS